MENKTKQIIEEYLKNNKSTETSRLSNSFKSGFVAIIGRPNVGKSTLLNTILNYPLSIVTKKAQTTRDNIKGIYSTINEQIIFIDTPGIHKPFNKLGEAMNLSALQAFDGVDLILLLVDLTKKFDDIDQEIIQNIKATKLPLGIVYTKKDLIKDETLIDNLIKHYEELKPLFTLKVSLLNNEDYLLILEELIKHLPNGPMYYPSVELTDKDERFLCKEIIREKILLNTSQEIPYAVAVEVESFKEDLDNPQLLNISCTIIVERSSQKMIIIGKNGQMIKKIGQMARIDLQHLLKKKIYLELFVKVEADWRNRDYYLKQFGYKNK